MEGPSHLLTVTPRTGRKLRRNIPLSVLWQCFTGQTQLKRESSCVSMSMSQLTRTQSRTEWWTMNRGGIQVGIRNDRHRRLPGRSGFLSKNWRMSNSLTWASIHTSTLSEFCKLACFSRFLRYKCRLLIWDHSFSCRHYLIKILGNFFSSVKCHNALM